MNAQNLFKVMLWGLLLVSQLTHAGNFEFTYRPDEGPAVMTFKGKYELWTLMGEPAWKIDYSWSIDTNEVILNPPKNTKSTSDQCAVEYGLIKDIPWDVVKQIGIVDIDFRGLFFTNGNSGGYYVFMDGGASPKPGIQGKQGTYYINPPGSPSWNELFYGKRDKTQNLSADAAKVTMKHWQQSTFPKADIDVAKVEFNLWPVRKWLDSKAQECKKELAEKKKQEAEQKRKEQAQQSEFEKALEQQLGGGSSSSQSDFESQLNQIANGKSSGQSDSFEQALGKIAELKDSPNKSARANLTLEGNDFESKLGNVNAYHEKLEKIKKEEQERERQRLAKLEKERQEAQARARQEQQARLAVYKASAGLSQDYKVEGGRDSKYGYTQNGSFVIPARYDAAYAFKDGVALVCNNYERYGNKYDNSYFYIDSSGSQVGQTVVEQNNSSKCSGSYSSPRMPLDINAEPHRKESYSYSCNPCGRKHSYTGSKQYYYQYQYDIFGVLISQKEEMYSTGYCPITLCTSK